MILYDYKCNECKKVFEKFARVHDLTCECTHCGEIATRLISAATIKLDPITFPGARAKFIKQHEKAGRQGE